MLRLEVSKSTISIFHLTVTAYNPGEFNVIRNSFPAIVLIYAVLLAIQVKSLMILLVMVIA
jgi:hypothetical protein